MSNSCYYKQNLSAAWGCNIDLQDHYKTKLSHFLEMSDQARNRVLYPSVLQALWKPWAQEIKEGALLCCDVEGILESYDEALWQQTDPRLRNKIYQKKQLSKAIQSLKSQPQLVILGTGGSSLGGQAIQAFVEGVYGQPLLSDAERQVPEIFFWDNVDPHALEHLTQQDFSILAISKSGSTAETLAQTLTLTQGWSQEKKQERLVFLTEPKPSPMNELAELWGCLSLAHDAQVGGRFSVFSVVGLLPALIMGLPIEHLLHGAYSVWEEALASPVDSSAVQGGVYAGISSEKLSNAVIMPYVDSLAIFGLWYRQLWAESLGKEGKGSTPIRALGTVDQHSQLQLYLDGPEDKTYTVIKGVEFCSSLPMSANLPESLQYLHNRTLGELLDAEAQACIQVLERKKLPVRTLTCQFSSKAQITENLQILGALFMHFTVETLVSAWVLNVNPFDQPAVEAIKVLTRENLKASAKKD